MAFLRRLSWEQLQQAGLRLVSDEFVIARKPLSYNFQRLEVGTRVPDFVPQHRLRQLYRMRLVDAVTDTVNTIARPKAFSSIVPPASATASSSSLSTPVAASAPSTLTSTSAQVPLSSPVSVAIGVEEVEADQELGDEDLEAAVVEKAVAVAAPSTSVYKPRMRGKNAKEKAKRS